MRGLTFAGRLASRNPRAFGGSLAFAVVFSFVAANAMWYQPGAHPSPFLRTRLPFVDPQAAKAAARRTAVTPKVTTFVIQREDEEQQTASIEQPKPEPETEAGTVRDYPAEPAATPATDAALVTDIQKELARRGLLRRPGRRQDRPEDIGRDPAL